MAPSYLAPIHAAPIHAGFGGTQTDRSDAFRTNMPQRLDRLPWSRLHWLFETAGR
jgi:hypothetical protein